MHTLYERECRMWGSAVCWCICALYSWVVRLWICKGSLRQNYGLRECIGVLYICVYDKWREFMHLCVYVSICVCEVVESTERGGNAHSLVWAHVLDTEKYRLRGKDLRREKETDGTRQSWTDGTAVTDIFNERLRTENSCSVTSINENLHESQAKGNGFIHLQFCFLMQWVF